MRGKNRKKEGVYCFGGDSLVYIMVSSNQAAFFSFLKAQHPTFIFFEAILNNILL